MEPGPRGTLSARFQVGNLRRRPDGSPEFVNCASKKCSGKKLFNQVGGDLLGMQLIAQLWPREALRRLPAAKAAKSLEGSIEKGREPTYGPEEVKGDTAVLAFGGTNIYRLKNSKHKEAIPARSSVLTGILSDFL